LGLTRQQIEQALQQAGGNRTAAARAWGSAGARFTGASRTSV
jgi:hypothetical protein